MDFVLWESNKLYCTGGLMKQLMGLQMRDGLC